MGSHGLASRCVFVLALSAESQLVYKMVTVQGGLGPRHVSPSPASHGFSFPLQSSHRGHHRDQWLSGSHPLELRAQRAERWAAFFPLPLPTKCSHTVVHAQMRCPASAATHRPRQCQAGQASEQIGTFWSLEHVGKPATMLQPLSSAKENLGLPSGFQGVVCPWPRLCPAPGAGGGVCTYVYICT